MKCPNTNCKDLRNHFGKDCPICWRWGIRPLTGLTGVLVSTAENADRRGMRGSGVSAWSAKCVRKRLCSWGLQTSTERKGKSPSSRAPARDPSMKGQASGWRGVRMGRSNPFAVTSLVTIQPIAALQQAASSAEILTLKESKQWSGSQAVFEEELRALTKQCAALKRWYEAELAELETREELCARKRDYERVRPLMKILVSADSLGFREGPQDSQTSGKTCCYCPATISIQGQPQGHGWRLQ